MNSRNTAKTYVIPTAAAGGLTLQMRGRFIYIAAATENVNIAVFDEDNNQIGDIENFPTGLGQPFPEGFSQLVVTMASGNAGTASLIMGTDMATFTMLTGTVNIIDTNSPEAIATSGAGWRADISLTNTGSGLITALQVFNPPASTKVAVLSRMRMFAPNGPGSLRFYECKPAQNPANLTNLMTMRNRNMDGGATQPQVVVSAQQGAIAHLGDPVGWDVLPTANGTDDVTFDVAPQLIPPGYAMQWQTIAINISMLGSITWKEK